MPIAWTAIVFLAFGIVLSMVPVGGPNPTPQTMNYTVVINSAVWGGSLLYYFIDAHKFTGPKITLDVSELSPEQEEALREEGLNVEIEGHAPASNSEEEIGENKGEKMA